MNRIFGVWEFRAGYVENVGGLTQKDAMQSNYPRNNRVLRHGSGCFSLLPTGIEE